jgi:hypothetical protein
MSMERAQGLSLVLMGVFALPSLLPHWLLWGAPNTAALGPAPYLTFLAVFAGGIVVHEGLHAVGYAQGGATRPEIEFGINWRGLAPYAHCTAPLRCGVYRWAVALPGLVLGVLPLGVGLLTGVWAVTLVAYVMLVAAAGDALLLWTLRGVSRDAWVQDHPHKMGALVLGHPASPVAPALAFEPGAEAPNGEAEADASPL